MALSDYVNFKAAEWTHDDNATRNRETERSNRASEQIKREQLAWEKEKFPRELEANLEIAKNRGLYGAQTNVQGSLTQQERAQTFEVNKVQPHELNKVATSNLGTLMATQAANENRLAVAQVNAQTQLGVAGIQQDTSLRVSHIQEQTNLGIASAKIASEQEIAKKQRQNDISIAGIKAFGDVTGSVTKSIFGR